MSTSDPPNDESNAPLTEGQKKTISDTVAWAASLARGTVITEKELEDKFGISYPFGSKEEHAKIRLRYVSLRGAFEKLLGNNHKRVLAPVPRTTQKWKILESNEHATRATDILDDGIRKTLKKAKFVVRNTEVSELTAQELAEHKQAVAETNHAQTVFKTLDTFKKPLENAYKSRNRFAKTDE